MKFKYIFHIDDDQDDTEFFFSAALEASHGVNVEIFFDSRKALEKLLDMDVNVMPDAIFLDLNMPVLSGFEFLKEIKCHSSLKMIQVIILSTSSQQESKETAKKLGADGFITKPSNFYELVSILKSYL
ncbi:response regulator receiver domain-containing protein [Flavobacterium sp. 9]|uniref:response regulator n=1 Tax=Flavobacterium sp. 9 TaxID=2035198 RepID=UPI000C19E707|nr:response regulator [Flavobacterium sp. 9]PIF34448.1 response regulator receiver domain-containing protein [Flavobacterium sp. 9]